jgi:hypothetical protein
MWKLELKDKCIHKYIHDHMHIYGENMTVTVGLAEVGEDKTVTERE